jgi:hypothetical protein
MALTDTTNSNLYEKVTSEFALQALFEKLAPITDFAQNFNDLQDRKGASIVVPVFNLSAAADFNADTNNYCGGTNEADAATVNLDKHLVKSFVYTDYAEWFTNVNWLRDTAIAIGDSLGRGIYNTVIALLNDTNVSATTSASLSALEDFTGLVKDVYDKHLDLGETVLMLSPEYYGNLLGVLKYAGYGAVDPIQNGRVPSFIGFKSVVCAPGLPQTWKGALVDRNSIGIASRYLAPMPGAGYSETWRATDTNSGLTIGYRVGQQICSGYRFIAGEALFGAKILRPEGLVSIK